MSNKQNKLKSKLCKRSGIRICNFDSEMVKNHPRKKSILGSSRTILLCIVGKLAGGGYVAVAFGVSEMCQVTGDTRHITRHRFSVSRLWDFSR